MSKIYTLLDPILFLKEEEYQKEVERLQNDEKAFPPIYVKLLERPFESWITQIEGMHTEDVDASQMVTMRCQYSVIKVPQKITDGDIEKSKTLLDQKMASVMSDIIAESCKLLETND